MITEQQARRRIGAAVVYQPPYHGPIETGVITGVGDSGLVFVRYGRDGWAKATNPEDLWFIDPRDERTR